MLRIAGLRTAGARLVMLVLLITGCTKPDSAPTDTTTNVDEPRPSVALRVLVVNEPELAEAIDRMRGEWAERTSGELQATTANWADVSTAKSIDVDVIVFASRYLGELSVRGWLRPVRAHVLQSKEFAADDLFPVVRQELMKWGGQVMAVPLGAQIVTAVDAEQRQWRPTLRLLARAAPHVVTRERLGVLFDSETMKPRITEPGFVEALQELVELSKAENEPEVGPDESFSGVYLQGRGAENDREVMVPVIGYGDRLAAVTASSRNAASAFKLLEWLAQAEISSQFAGAGSRPLPVRRSLATNAKWYGTNLTQVERSQRAKVIQDALTSEQWLMIPRLPGIDKYIAILDSEVKAALDRDVPPREALENAAQGWEEFTESRGREKQREAYLEHLGIAE